jgi:hypothetical protein
LLAKRCRDWLPLGERTMQALVSYCWPQPRMHACPTEVAESPLFTSLAWSLAKRMDTPNIGRLLPCWGRVITAHAFEMWIGAFRGFLNDVKPHWPSAPWTCGACYHESCSAMVAENHTAQAVIFLSEWTQVRRRLEPGSLKVPEFQRLRRITRAPIAIYQVSRSHDAPPRFLVLRILAYDSPTKCDEAHKWRV